MRPLLTQLSIRWRLAVITAALTFLILTLFAVVIGQLTASRVRSDFNNETAAAIDELRDRLRIAVEDNKIVVKTGVNTFAAATGAVIRVVDQQTRVVIAATDKAPAFPLPPDGGPSTEQAAGYRVETRRTFLRPTSQPGISFSSRPVFVQYARRVSDVEATVRRVRFFLVLGVMFGTTLSLAGSVVLARRSLAPIARLTGLAKDIGTTGETDRRVPIPDTDDEVAELARTLDEMLATLTSSRRETQELLDRQRQFVSDASHELRTPLTAVLANLELLAETLDGERGEAAQSALRSTRRMKRLVADLLLLARADASRSAPRAELDLRDVIMDAAGELGAIAGDHVFDLDLEPARIVGARDDLHRLVLNLMENALRFTPAGTRVEVDVRRTGTQVVLSVEDDGPGVPEELRGSLFDRFVRGAGDRGGSFGLGLSIVRAVAEAHGGTVSLAPPRDGVGARFVVTLPAAPVTAATLV